MKIKELVAHLLEMDQELDVYTAKDAEGNGYNRVNYEPEVRFILEEDVGSHYLDSAYDPEDWKTEQEDGYIDEGEVPVEIAII